MRWLYRAGCGDAARKKPLWLLYTRRGGGGHTILGQSTETSGGARDRQVFRLLAGRRRAKTEGDVFRMLLCGGITAPPLKFSAGGKGGGARQLRSGVVPTARRGRGVQLGSSWQSVFIYWFSSRSRATLTTPSISHQCRWTCLPLPPSGRLLLERDYDEQLFASSPSLSSM